MLRQRRILVVLALLAPSLAAGATQEAMTVVGGSATNASPKYRNAMAVRSVSGGQVMNVLTVPALPTSAQGGAGKHAWGEWLSRQVRFAKILSRRRNPEFGSAIDRARYGRDG
jgi:hypothetical protein